MIAPLLPFAAAFRLGVALRHAGYRHGWFKTRRLERPVVSVGNLTVGGTGKTPLVAYVAKLLLRRGRTPSILTRGYARRGSAEMTIVAPGAGRCPTPWEIGDEPALLARMLPEVPLIVCADRFRGGRAAEERFHVDAHILDDGFQHLALGRDVDIVAIDSTQPLSDWELLPAGRQREPLAALRRASMVVLTRTDSGDPQWLEDRVLKIHPAARLYRSRTEWVRWVDVASGAEIPPGEFFARHVSVFCAIGNPAAFFADVRRWGFNLLSEDAFPDHHVYTEQDIRQLAANARAQGATALLTTQKDAVKLGGEWKPPLPIWACEIQARILNAEDFATTLLTYLEKAH